MPKDRVWQNQYVGMGETENFSEMGEQEEAPAEARGEFYRFRGQRRHSLT